MYKEVDQCRICGNPRLETVLDLGMRFLTGVFPAPGEEVEEAPLQLVKCTGEGDDSHCGLVQLRHSFEPETMYGANYGYRSGLNRSMVSHLNGIAQLAKTGISLNPGDLVLDIGSNDGTLLKAMAEPGVTLLGMDPTGAKFKEFYDSDAQLIPDFFSADRFFEHVGQSRRAKIVTSIAMFYDLEHPIAFMKQVKRVLANDGVWIFEQSYLPSMIDQTAYDTICHEHLEYYSLRQIVWMTERSGLTIRDVHLNSANGGSFRVLVTHSEVTGHSRAGKISKMLRDEEAKGLGSPHIYATFRERVFRHRDELHLLLEQSRHSGKTVLGYGASTKGNVLLQVCGIGAKHLQCIAEVNPDKFGRVTPGSRIPILSESDALAKRPDAFLVLPWHFRDDIISRAHNYLVNGRAFIFPLPTIEVYRHEGASDRL
jgi:hypothetical protein